VPPDSKASFLRSHRRRNIALSRSLKRATVNQPDSGAAPIPISPRSGTKIAEVIALLQRGDGSTLAELVAATDWLARRSLDPIGEHAHEQPFREMGGSDPAQVVSPLEAKLIRVEVGNAPTEQVLSHLSQRS
jgi:uncharacterized protein DUF3489